MKKKTRKVGEAATPYAAKKAGTKVTALKSAERVQPSADDAAFKMVTDKIFSERKELLHKLAQ